jgi:membrane protein implicated in regulation of membrane protease activity
MRLAKPMLLVIVPVGVVWGLVEAARFHPALAFLMFLLLSVISMFIWMTVRRIRSERAAEQASDPPSNR